jgi:hypothetical protein
MLMPQIELQPGDASERIWIAVGGKRLIPLRAGDDEGMKLAITWLVDSETISAEDGATTLDVTVRTVEMYQGTYAETENSADLVDRRHFGAGQQTDYAMEPHKPELIRWATMNLVRGEPNSERGLAGQMGNVIDDRTAGRHLHEMGWRAAEANGLAEEVAEYVEAERQKAYWKGVAGEPLESAADTTAPGEWQPEQRGWVGVALGIAHLVLNGTYTSLDRLNAGTQSVLAQWPPMRVWHTLLVYLLASGGARLSQAKHFDWRQVGGLLIGCAGLSATSLRKWMIAVAQKAKEKVNIRRSNGQGECITRLQDYQEEGVAQRLQRGLIKGETVYLDDYVNIVFRREPVARAKHGVLYRVFKAFRRHLAQDADTGHAVTCPLGSSDVTPLTVLEQVVEIINGGLDRARPGWELKLVIADRWWSAKTVIEWALGKGLGLMTWGKDVKTVKDALAGVSEEELKQHPVKEIVRDEESGEMVEQVIGYRLDTDLSIYDLDVPIRCIVEWDGKSGSKKLARLVVGVEREEMDQETTVDALRFRQRVEIALKLLQRRVNWSAFGGGAATVRPDERDKPDEEEHKRLKRNRRQVTTRRANDQAKLEEVEQELEQLRRGEAPTNKLRLGIRELKKLAQELRQRIQRSTERLSTLDALLKWAGGRGPRPEEQPVADLDLARESILTQLKLDVFSAQETLVDDFIEQALKPVLWEEAESQAAARQEQDTRSTAKGREGKPLCTDVTQLYHTKLANLERETILSRLLSLQGEFVRHKTKRIILMVADRFTDRRMQAAYERYCVILNQRNICVPLDDDEPWRLLFTYHLDTPSSSARFK